MRTRKQHYQPTLMSVVVNSSTKICHACAAKLPHNQMTEVHPVPGLTLYRCPACVAQLAAILAYAKSRWCWDDAPMLEELYERHPVETTVEAWVDELARDYGLIDPRDAGLLTEGEHHTMSAQTSAKTERAIALLREARARGEKLTPYAAAKQTGIALSTMYRSALYKALKAEENPTPNRKEKP